MELINKNDSKLKKTLVFHLNKIGSLIIYILLPEQLKDNPKQMRFLHKCENNQLEIKIKDNNNIILIDYSYIFKDNTFSVINIKKTLPKIISLSIDQNNIKYLTINYSITKSTINDYYFTSIILNYDTSFDYLEKIIEKMINKNFNKIKIKNIYCSNCNNILFNSQKEIIYDYDSSRIEQNLEEFFNCQNNYNSFMENKEATNSIENLKKVYEIKCNMDIFFLWIFIKYLDNNIQNNNSNKNIQYIFCNKCKEVIGKCEEYNNILFNKYFLNLINMDLIIDDNENLNVNIINFFSVEYLHILLTDSIKKGNKNLNFINLNKNLKIIFEIKINILGLIDKNCKINSEDFKNILIDNYINLFEVDCIQIEKNELIIENISNIILNERDFILLENIIQNNMEFYFSELFFYKLLINENKNKNYYCFAIPKKK